MRTRRRGAGEEDLVTLRRAGLLHDIGKLGISNLILDKPSRFAAFAELAAARHERLDGRGYHLGLEGAQLGPLARILAVADVCEALSAERPYRAALPRDEVLGIMRQQVGTGLCPVAFEALKGLQP